MHFLCFFPQHLQFVRKVGAHQSGRHRLAQRHVAHGAGAQHSHRRRCRLARTTAAAVRAPHNAKPFEGGAENGI